MKVGDLVRYKDNVSLIDLGLGIVLGFDDEGDPIVYFHGESAALRGRSLFFGEAYFSRDVEVVNESR